MYDTLDTVDWGFSEVMYLGFKPNNKPYHQRPNSRVLRSGLAFIILLEHGVLHYQFELSGQS